MVGVATPKFVIFFFNDFLLQLANTEEFIDGALTGNLGEVLIRCV